MDDDNSHNEYNNDKSNDEDVNRKNSLAFVKTYKRLSKRGSAYKLFNFGVSEKNIKKEKSIESSNSSEFSSSSNSTKKKIKKKVYINSIPDYIDTKQNKNSYLQEKHFLPLKILISEALQKQNDYFLKQNKYYSNLNLENNFGSKHKKLLKIDENNTKIPLEEIIEKNGLNESFTNSNSISVQKKLKKLKFVEFENSKFKLFKSAYNNKNTVNSNKLTENKIFYGDQYYTEKINLKRNKFYSNHKKNNVLSLMKKDEFAQYLIEKYLYKIYKNNFTIESNDKIRRLFVIRDSTVITNPKIIPGIFVTIPSTNELSKFSSIRRKVLFKKFLLYCKDKLKSLKLFNYIYIKTGEIIYDLIDIKPNEKYIFISPTSLFQNLSIPLNKNILNLYNKHFNEDDDRNGCFVDSSEDEEKNKGENNDDLYDIYFGKKRKNGNKNFKVIKVKNYKKNNLFLNKSFTHGLNDEIDENYYFSDEEKRRESVHRRYYKKYNKKIDYFIEAENDIFEKKINKLLTNLSSNPLSKISSKNVPFPSDDKLMSKYLKEKKIVEKKMLKSTVKSKPLKNQDIIDVFVILQQYDKNLSISKFIKHKNEKKFNLPFIEKNKIAIENKYLENYKRTLNEFPTILSYNLPLILSKNKKYSRYELCALYTKFKSLVNLWFNMHNNLKVLQIGIDFDTFRNSTIDLSSEDALFVRKIVDEIISGSSGMLSLEDFVNALNMMNRDDLNDELEFFLKVFNLKDKKKFMYNDVKEISKMAIKRLIKGNKNSPEAKDVIMELSEFFVKYMFETCNKKIEDGLTVADLKKLIDEKKDIEYLKIFCCTLESKNNNVFKNKID